MGFMSFLKKIFVGGDEDDAELQAARARHGIKVDEKDGKEEREPYDTWEEIRDLRANFFFGSWATRKFKHRVIGEDKVKKQLADLEKKREEEAKQKEEVGK